MSNDTLTLARVRACAKSGQARRIRLEARLSLADLARACGVVESTIHRWETGQRAPRGEAALRYASLLDALNKTHRQVVA